MIATAVRIVDRHGLQALTMRRLGASLGVEAMAIYKHVPGKQALIDGMVEFVIAEEPLPSSEVADWREWLKQLALGLRRIARAHPNLFPLIAARPLNTPDALRPVEMVFARLEEGGLRGKSALHGWRIYAAYVVGYIVNELGGFFGEGRPGEEWRLDLDALPREEFPRIRGMAHDIRTSDHDREFELGLDVVLAALGVEAAGGLDGSRTGRSAGPSPGGSGDLKLG